MLEGLGKARRNEICGTLRSLLVLDGQLLWVGSIMMKIDIDESGPYVLATLSGDFDTASGETFSTSLQEHAGRQLLLDLSGVEFISSTGLGAMMILVARARAGGGNVILVSPSAFVQGVFETTRLDRWFDISATLEDAVARLRDK